MAGLFHIRRQGFPERQASLFNLGIELFGELHQIFLCRYREGYSGGANLPGVFGYCPQ
jgi:hypothetical protein